MDDLPIIELPEHYRVDGEKLGMALAHVSAQASSIAEHQVKLQQRQSLYEEEHQRSIEQYVTAAREEAKARSNALILAIQQAYGDPSTLELRVDTRIHNVLQQLQYGAQEQARAFAESRLADQAQLNQLVEERMQEALQHIEHEVNMRVERRIQNLREDISKYVEDRLQVAVQRSEDIARAVVRVGLQDCRGDQDATARAESRVVELVRAILDQQDKASRNRQKLEREEISGYIDKRLRQVVEVTKTAAETKAREVVALKMSENSSPTCSSPVALTESSRVGPPVTTPPTPKIRPKQQLRQKRRSQQVDDRPEEAVRIPRRIDRRSRVKIDRIRQEAQEVIQARADTRAAEILSLKPKRVAKH